MTAKKPFIFFSLFLLLASNSFAQVLIPAKWTLDISKKEVKVGEETELIFRVKIINDWYLYSSDFDPDLGPTVTTFEFVPDDSYKTVGKIRPIGAKEKYDDLWEGNYTYFTKTAEFRQTVKILKADPKISGTYDYQVCTDVDGKCIPFDDEFTFDQIKVKMPKVAEAKDPIPTKEDESERKPTRTSELVAETPIEDTSIIGRRDGGSSADTVALADANTGKNIDAERDKPMAEIGEAEDMLAQPEISLLGFFFLALLSGVVALLTPCVFPMIPMTVTFFTNSGESRSKAIRKALFYGLSIVAIYTIIGTVVAKLAGPEAANFLSTHWLPNLFFFVVFLLFACSFLGMFEIVLPSWLVNRADRQADKGGMYGVFFMAFTLVLVSFSCTGPIVGSILVQSAGGETLKPIVGMFGFSLAFAIPFTLFAVFPSWLNSLPKSGGWLNSVKVVLGFLELALAFKFLSIADQVYHWHILDREIFLAIWIVVFFMLGLYLLGKLQLPHDSELQYLSVPRLLMAVATFIFVVYMIPGMFGAPLKALAGYLPPSTSQDFNLNKLQYLDGGTSASPANDLCEKPLYGDFLELPLGIEGYYDYAQALECSEKTGKPVFVDFTGHGCVNCREMETRVWSDPQVLKLLKKDFIVVALYADDKTELPEEKWYRSDYDGKMKKTIGAQNADLQILDFNNNAQPLYVILDSKGKLLTPPKSYDLSVENFVKFLEKGKANFEAGR